MHASFIFGMNKSRSPNLCNFPVWPQSSHGFVLNCVSHILLAHTTFTFEKTLINTYTSDGNLYLGFLQEITKYEMTRRRGDRGSKVGDRCGGNTAWCDRGLIEGAMVREDFSKLLCSLFVLPTDLGILTILSCCSNLLDTHI